MLPLWLACVSAPKPDATGPADTQASGLQDSATPPTLPAGLNGVEPRAPVELPAFRALAQSGAERGRDDLLGQPTVLWFFPAANTSG
jgi:hypothetical protein